ncbi:hypothetical protein ACTIVE_8877 [Actinomadura verrucosospora]|uniref:Uncharacterized protein n=1 Tax=Actinomadura verrucosospora TaxID=46165 RepID=A0A7D4A7U1_ACTVE|nr:hypothetical protein ACTIVE_8877 [Actinomadura verrucosospora]
MPYGSLDGRPDRRGDRIGRRGDIRNRYPAPDKLSFRGSAPRLERSLLTVTGTVSVLQLMCFSRPRLGSLPAVTRVLSMTGAISSMGMPNMSCRTNATSRPARPSRRSAPPARDRRTRRARQGPAAGPPAGSRPAACTSAACPGRPSRPPW